MKKSTVVLTAALAASVFGLGRAGIAAPATTAQALASLTPKGYDATLAANSLAANSDAAAMLAAINAVRRGNGLPQLTLDASLGAATMYQETDELQYHYVGSYGLLNNGAKQVTPAQMAADFGSAATGVQEYAFGNGFFMGDTDNWPALMSDWQQNDASFTAMLNDPSVNVCGITLVDTGSIGSGGAHVYKWVLSVGYNPGAVSTATTSTGPAINLTGLNQALANQALAAQPTADETNLLASINSYRAIASRPALQQDKALYAAAYYNLHTTSGPNMPTLATDFGSLRTTFLSGTTDNGSVYYGYLTGYYGQWDILRDYWRISDPSFQDEIRDATYSHCGLSIVDTKATRISPLDGLSYEIYRWTLLVGK